MYEMIPEELKALRNWVNFRFLDDPERHGHPKKVPIDPETLHPAKANDPGTWSSFERAAENAASGLCDGIGFEFAPAPDGTPYFGVDLDDCEDAISAWKRGECDNIVAEFIMTLGSYAEYSVSGHGIHILCRGSLPEGGRRRAGVEMYDSGRFFIMTGNPASDFTGLRDAGAEIRTLHEKYIRGGRVPSAFREPAPPPPDAAQVIALAEKSRRGQLFSELMAGHWDAYYTSQSEADLALANMLAFWCRRDTALMDQIFRMSGLMREKWDRPQSGSTYGALTLAKAARECAQVYEPRRERDYRIGVGNSPEAAASEGSTCDFRRYTLDDTGVACRMADMFGEVLRFCFPEKRFYFFDGRRWTEDNIGAICLMADEAVEAVRADADAYVDAFGGERDADELRSEYAKFVKKCRANMTKQAFLRELRAHLPVLPSELDAHPELLNTPSGVVDLKSGALLPHDPSLLLTRVTRAEYSPSAECPRWKQFLEDVFAGDRALIRFVQKAVGYSLTASVREQVIFFAVGEGSNGKSTFLETLAGAMGDYASNAQPDTILARTKGSGISSDLARLKGTRFVTVPEPAEGARLDEGLVKQLSGGDRITARRLYADEMEFTPEFKLWLGTNHKPVIRGTDFGIWRRICIIPFIVKIPPERVDRGLRWKLERESAGILRWAVDGALLWNTEGLAPYPDCILESLKEYRNEMDVVNAFLSECTVPAGEVVSSELYRAYTAWAREGNEYVMSATKFGRECAKRFEKVRRSRGFMLKGVSLLQDHVPYRITAGEV